VDFREEDVVHPYKITDRYGNEPKCRVEIIRQIKAGEFKMFNATEHSSANFSIRRARELTCALREFTTIAIQ
jgi:hypothetical protein